MNNCLKKFKYQTPFWKQLRFFLFCMKNRHIEGGKTCVNNRRWGLLGLSVQLIPYKYDLVNFFIFNNTVSFANI